MAPMKLQVSIDWEVMKMGAELSAEEMLFRCLYSSIDVRGIDVLI